MGTFAIQLAKLFGAEVTGVDASPKLDAVLAVGADRAINCKQQDFAKTEKTYDLIVDCQATRPMSAIKHVLKSGGTYAVVGGQMKRVDQLLLHSIFDKLTGESRKLRVVMEGPNKGLAELKELLEAGKLIPLIDQTYLLHEAPEALSYFGKGLHKGKIAISIVD